jgi:hypothetical protein
MGLKPPTPSAQERRSELGKPESAPPKEDIKPRPERTKTSTAKDASSEFDRSQLVPKMVDQKKSQGISEGLADMDDRDLLPSCFRLHEAERKKVNGKDRVAFLLYRAPETSHPSKRLNDLETTMPIELARMQPMHKTQFCWKNHNEVERDTRFVRMRDRLTEYTEVKLLQANILRKG